MKMVKFGLVDAICQSNFQVSRDTNIIVCWLFKETLKTRDRDTF